MVSYFLNCDRSTLLGLIVTSYFEVGEEAAAASKSNCHSYRILSPVLCEEFVLRNGPFYGHRSMLLRCCEGGGIPCSHQECGRGGQITL